jgi:hypothetical protein
MDFFQCFPDASAQFHDFRRKPLRHTNLLMRLFCGSSSGLFEVHYRLGLGTAM